MAVLYKDDIADWFAARHAQLASSNMLGYVRKNSETQVEWGIEAPSGEVVEHQIVDATKADPAVQRLFGQRFRMVPV